MTLTSPLALYAPDARAQAKAAPTFDAWSEAFAADWVRLSAERATTTQYFSGAEQAALERQLTPLTPERRVYNVSGQPMTEVAIDRGILRDLYVALGDPVGPRERAGDVLDAFLATHSADLAALLAA